jgi:peroxiredoxin
MNEVMLVARIVLALVLGVAGVAKLFDLKRSRTAIADFGLPDWLATPIGLCLPFVELSIACLLLPTNTVWWGAAGSVALLAAFVFGISVNLARGKRPDCNCFGQLYSEPIGPATLARNGVLLILSALVLARAVHNPGLSLSAVLTMSGNYAVVSMFGVVLALAIIIEGWLIFHVLRQNGRLLLRIEALEASGVKTQPRVQPGLKVGTPAPSFELPLAKGGGGSLDRLRELGKPILLLFSDANCGPCKAMRPDLTRWERDYSDKLTIAVVTRGATPEKIAQQNDLKFVFVQKDREVAGQYQAFGTPTAVLVGTNGLVASALLSGAPAISSLVNAVASGNLPTVPAPQRAPRRQPTALQIGTPAPSLTLPDLAGKSVSIADFQGRQTILLFWNPGCGFCGRMLPGLKQWEKSSNGNAPRMVLISTGTPEQNRAMDLGSQVLLDQDQGALSLFGAHGTPSAVLLDESGKVASALLVGGDAVLALASGEKRVPGEAAKSVAVSAGLNGN